MSTTAEDTYLRPRAQRALTTLQHAHTEPTTNGWVCSMRLQHWRSAGQGWWRALSELRNAGHTITKQVCHCPTRCRPRRDAARERGDPAPVRYAYRLELD
ncbi:hypothetical protein ER308_07235 [Egibacter rhizosphaerae]|uniref:Uncharacterized protein n=1 Tax=Egibacter rhizosphaerae TaxID=1670831 RepID=A0A411YDT0_9ACTN|nr:hypothetical protein [Egibacter rhizosphaerae]QBI19358.1 hypothetical protein ER308_07235 [Egibacter rhizosphaerae]